MNALGIQLIKAFEKCRLKAYKDGGGVWTCGWGATGPGVTSSTVWTQAQADKRFEDDVNKTEGVVASLIHVQVSSNQLSALVSFTYNVGANNFRTSTLLKKLNKGDYVLADEFLRWVFDNKVFVQGLMNRRVAEAALFTENEPLVLRLIAAH